MTSGHLEVETKYDVDVGFVVPDLSGIPGVTTVDAPVEHLLEASYFDTADLRLLRAGLALAALIAGLSFVLPWLAELEARRAIQSWRGDPARAFSDLGRSRDLNPLSARADLLEGAIASRTDDLPRMAAAFQRAIDRNDRDWYAHLELALADAGLRRWRVALAELARASRLNPREETIGLVRADVAAKRPIDRDRIDRLFVERVRTRVGP